MTKYLTGDTLKRQHTQTHKWTPRLGCGSCYTVLHHRGQCGSKSSTVFWRQGERTTVEMGVCERKGVSALRLGFRVRELVRFVKV